MHTRHVTSLACSVILILCAGTSASAQDKLVLVPVRASEVMTAAQLQQTGVTSLTPQQRLMLDAFLTRYTAELRAALASPAGARVAQAPHSNGSASDDSGPPEVEEGETAQGRIGPRPGMWLGQWAPPPGARVSATPEDGGYVRLADGTVWEVYTPDRTATVVWKPGDYVVVSPAPMASNEYDFLLVNATDRTRALARFVDVVRPRRR